VYAIVLFPLLVLVLSLVYVVGNVEDLRSKIRADLDMAALTATQALDPTALASGAPPRLLPDEAAQLARQYLAQNLAGLGSVLAESLQTQPRRPTWPSRTAAPIPSRARSWPRRP